MTSVRSQQHHYKNLRLLGELEIESYNKKKKYPGAGLLGVPGWCSGGRWASGRRNNSRTFFALVVLVSLRGLSQRLLCATSLRKEIEYTGACIVL